MGNADHDGPARVSPNGQSWGKRAPECPKTGASGAVAAASRAGTRRRLQCPAPTGLRGMAGPPPAPAGRSTCLGPIRGPDPHVLAQLMLPLRPPPADALSLRQCRNRNRTCHCLTPQLWPLVILRTRFAPSAAGERGIAGEVPSPTSILSGCATKR